MGFLPDRYRVSWLRGEGAPERFHKKVTGPVASHSLTSALILQPYVGGEDTASLCHVSAPSDVLSFFVLDERGGHSHIFTLS